ncbi:MAG TPA: glycosyltransferase [Candidatus Acidoferrum sp.]|nr:glycosyltransferase [Candidatus Acidoferrum sp.]
MNPLVSILIPAHNAEDWVADTIRSAVAQTWPRKEIIVVDDGSTDGTADVARRFASKQVAVICRENQGAAATRNHALQFCQGDYIQWLDADDILALDKIERQLAALREGDGERTLLSSAWATFSYRTSHAQSVPTSLWQDLSPVEWFLKKMGENLYMQTATWLTSRRLTQAAGPWDTRLLSDDDVEYFCRVLMASDRIRFVPDARVFYRITPASRLSYVGTSDKKKEALVLSLKLQIQHIRSVEDSDRVRKSCLACLKSRLGEFYPERPDLVAELQALAEQLGGAREIPRLRRKYAWMQPIFGAKVAKSAQIELPRMKAWVVRCWDKAIHSLETSRVFFSHILKPKSIAREDSQRRD